MAIQSLLAFRRLRRMLPATITVITLTSGELGVDEENVTIAGPGANVLEITRDNNAPCSEFSTYSLTTPLQ